GRNWTTSASASPFAFLSVSATSLLRRAGHPATIPAPELPGSGSDGRRPRCRPLSPTDGLPLSSPWYCPLAGLGDTAGDGRDDRRRRARARGDVPGSRLGAGAPVHQPRPRPRLVAVDRAAARRLPRRRRRPRDVRGLERGVLRDAPGNPGDAAVRT